MIPSKKRREDDGLFCGVNPHTDMDDPEIQRLFVEENPYDADLAILPLRKHNPANNEVHLGVGAEALDFVFETGQFKHPGIGHTPRVFFLDIKRPRVSRLEVLQRIKSDLRTKSIPVIRVTSPAEEPDVKQSYEPRTSGYIIRPVNFENFAKTNFNAAILLETD